ncbi:MAG: tRNA (adenosine(37)-N6)-threonylcarbamoyltransferase complex transferase subunit TsaD, partial [Candidatus Magasanikbacteria bacterium]
RKHAEKIVPTIEAVMNDFGKPDAIAVTSGPGLMTGLMVGVETAKALSYLWKKPIIPVNHLEGHIYSPKIQNLDQKEHIGYEFPALALIASGGHTELILMKDHREYEQIGATVDDAVGEAFDKVAQLLNLDYPGGPEIEQQAKSGDPEAISFPRPMIDSGDYDFSFSGLKTAVLYWLKDNQVGEDESLENICASFQQAAVDVLKRKVKQAIEEYDPNTVLLTGGVSANQLLRDSFSRKNYDIYFPLKKYCMDNATMIGIAGYYQHQSEEPPAWQQVQADPNLSL